MKKSLLLMLAVAAALNAADGATLFKKCAACYGAKGEKHALGKSKVISTLSAQQIETAIKGYQDGTYGGAMKGLMKGQVATLNAEQIKAIAEFIGAK